MRDGITLALLAAVFAGSILNQLPIRRWQALAARIDRWSFLPFWGFFGPKPAFAGTHVIYRDGIGDAWTGWRELDVPCPGPWSWLWNPARHERKALHDLLNGLALTAEGLRDGRRLELSNYHLALATWVMSQPSDGPGVTRRQFALVESVGHGAARGVRPVFVSRSLSLA